MEEINRIFRERRRGKRDEDDGRGTESIREEGERALGGEAGVSELLEEVAEDADLRAGGEEQLHLEVAMTEDVVIEMLGLFVGFGEADLLFVVFALVEIRRLFVLETRGMRPRVAKAIAERGRDEAEKELRQRVMEEGFDKEELTVARAQSVTMSEEATLAVERDIERLFMDNHARLACEPAERPDVVVADEEMDRAVRGEVAKRFEHSIKAAGFAGAAIEELTPKIEDIAQEKDRLSVLTHPAKTGDEPLLVRVGIGNGARAEMCVAEEIDHKLEHSKFHFRLFGHHILGPFGFEDDIDLHVLDLVNGVHFLSDIFYEKVRGRTGWSCKRHIDNKMTICLKVNIVDKPHIVDVDRNLRVVHRLEIAHDLLLRLQKLVLHIGHLLFGNASVKLQIFTLVGIHQRMRVALGAVGALSGTNRFVFSIIYERTIAVENEQDLGI